LSRGRFGTAFGDVTAVANFKQDSVFGRGQGCDDVVGQGCVSQIVTLSGRIKDF
jgi:hypothetical protein